MAWDLACRDWADRLRKGLPPVPDLPLNKEAADQAVAVFNRLRLHDVVGTPTRGEAGGEWFRQAVVRPLFGSKFGSLRDGTCYREIREIFLLVSKKNDKGLRLDTLIATPTGFTTMRDVKVGDFVIAPDGKSTQVTAKSAVHIGRKCFEIEFSTGETVVCDDVHLWVTDAHLDRGRQARDRKNPCRSVKSTAEIATTLKVQSGKYQINNHRTELCSALLLPDADLEIPPYVLGYWLGNGTTVAAQVTAGIHDAENVRASLAAAGYKSRVRSKRRGAATLSIAGAQPCGDRLPHRFVSAARALDLLRNKHIPHVYLRASRSQRLALLQGLMDSDGSISKAGQAVYTTTRPTLRDDVRELVNSLGLKSSIREARAAIGAKDYGRVWQVQFWPFDETPVFTLPRKLARQRASLRSNSPRSRTRQIVGVREVPSVPTQCIAVESETHQYLITRSLIPTHNTTAGAAVMMTALILNERPRGEFLLVAPSHAVAELAFNACVGMIEEDDRAQHDLDGKVGLLKHLFRVQPHLKRITHRESGATLRIKTFDQKIVVGAKTVGILLDEFWELAKGPRAANIMGQLRGGRHPIPEAFRLIITTQSDEPPVGIFKSELKKARDIRDGDVKATAMLPVLYEFPAEMIRSGEWRDPTNWEMVNPNARLNGRQSSSVTIAGLVEDWDDAQLEGDAEMRRWASQHLNLEIGMRGGLDDRWAGAEYWEQRADKSITLEAILKRCEVIIVGIDGGGLDDLFGLVVLGREIGTRKWLCWSHGWCHRGVLTRRKSIASTLETFAAARELTIVDDSLGDISAIVGIVGQINEAGLLACVAIDPEGLGGLVDALAEIGVTEEGKQLHGIFQGYRLMNAIKTTERKLVDGTLWHSGSTLMAWCVDNLKIEPTATAIRATKVHAGDAKIDLAMALFDAAAMMGTNPVAKGSSGWNTDDLDSLMARIDAAAAAMNGEAEDGGRSVVAGIAGSSEPRM